MVCALTSAHDCISINLGLTDYRGDTTNVAEKCH